MYHFVIVTDPKSVPCSGCKYRHTAHNQWSRFSEEVDNVAPFAVKTINLVKLVSRSVPSITGYTTNEMSDIQSSNPCLGKLIAWILSEKETGQRKLYLSGPAVNFFLYL